MQPAKLTSENLMSLLERAIAKREPIRAGGDTDALRIVDGRGDGFEDLEIDDFASRWLVQTRGSTFPGRVGVPPAGSGVSPEPSGVAGATYSKRRRLPHFEQPWAIYAITIITRNHRILSPQSRTIVINALKHFHLIRYELFAACVMPDHAHLLLQPWIKEQNERGENVFYSLGELMHSIKSFTAKEINKAEGIRGEVWEQERFDRYVRGDKDLEEKFHYIVENPWRADLVEQDKQYPWVWTQEQQEKNATADVSRETRDTAGGTPTLPETIMRRFAPTSIYWKKLGEKTAPVWIAGEQITEPFVIRENGVRYWLDFQSGYSQGIFLDQRENRAALRAQANGKTVLNCFAYTCAFGVSAALGGAQTVNLDLSKHYLEWGKRNYQLNHLDPASHEFIHGDVMNWLGRFARKERRFDFIILDPPTFSRDDRGRVFTIESGFPDLVRAAEKILASSGTLFCSTNQRSMSDHEFARLIQRGLTEPKNWELRGIPMPPDFTGDPYLKTLWVKPVV